MLYEVDWMNEGEPSEGGFRSSVSSRVSRYPEMRIITVLKKKVGARRIVLGLPGQSANNGRFRQKPRLARQAPSAE